MALDSLRADFYYQSEFLKKEKLEKCHFNPKQELSYLRNARSGNPILFSPSMKFCIGAKKPKQLQGQEMLPILYYASRMPVPMKYL